MLQQLGLYWALLALWIGFSYSLGDPWNVNRKLFERSVPINECRTTVGGRLFITDDRGVMCQRAQEDSMTGCCSTGQQFSCETCDMRDKCCSQYEACVSCCLTPEHKAKDIFMEGYRGPGHPETGKWRDEFEYCRGRCRTHGRSTVHENAYIDGQHFCFSRKAIPMVDEPGVPQLPYGVEATPGAPGEDCDKVCGKKEMRCLPQFFSSLNSCNLMRDFFPCEAACKRGEAEQHEAMYVTNEGSKAEEPASCFVGDADAKYGDDSCQWFKEHVRRLCPCR